jgi:stress-induced morphogen
MPIDLLQLENAIRTAIPVLHLDIEDRSNGCGENYAIVLVSEVCCARVIVNGFLSYNFI